MGKRRSRRQPEVDYLLPDGEYYNIIAYVAKGSDFTHAEAMLQADIARKR